MSGCKLLTKNAEPVLSATDINSDKIKKAFASSSDIFSKAASGVPEWDEEDWDPNLTCSKDKTKYYIVVYTKSQSTVVYEKDENGEYTKIVQRFTCSTGADNTPTITGTYRVRAKYRWRCLVNDVFGQYSTSISRAYLFHSVPYNKMEASTIDDAEYDKLGSPASHGCIRMCVRDCRWIYYNVPMGTKVDIVNESGPEGASVPKREDKAAFNGWDPSDRWAKGNPYFTQN